MKRFLGALCMSLMLSGGFGICGSDPVKDCPKDLVCFSIDEAAKIRQHQIDTDAKLAKLQIRLSKRVWYGGGVEYIGGSIDPYINAGVSLGHFGGWAGVYGETAAVGVGLTF